MDRVVILRYGEIESNKDKYPKFNNYEDYKKCYEKRVLAANSVIISLATILAVLALYTFYVLYKIYKDLKKFKIFQK